MPTYPRRPPSLPPFEFHSSPFTLLSLIETLTSLSASAAPIIPSIPYLEEEEELEDAPPIPIPVPRSQTPQLVVLDQSAYHPLPIQAEIQRVDSRFGHRSFDDDSPAPATRLAPPRPSVSHVQTAAAVLHHEDEPEPQLNPFSYGYGFSPSSASPPPASRSPFARSPPAAAFPAPRSPPRPSTSNVSGISRTIRSPSRPGKGLDGAGPPAVPVVDRRTVGGGKGMVHQVSTRGGEEKERGEREKEKNIKAEEVLWARWDEVMLHSTRTRLRRLLLIAYPSTFRIWDTTDLECISEVLRLPFASLDLRQEGEGQEREGEEPKLVDAKILPRKMGKEVAREGGEGPWLGMGFTSGLFLIYSLKTHRVLRRLTVGRAASPPPARGGGSWKSLGGARIETFEASGDVLVFSTTSPPALHVFSLSSSSSFEPLLEIPGARLALYAPPPPNQGPPVQASVGTAKAMLSSAVRGALGWNGDIRTQGNDNDDNMYNTNAQLHNMTTNSTTNLDIFNASNNNSNNNVLLAPQPTDPPPTPHPIFTLSHRLLAYASTSSTTTTSSISPSPSPIIQPTTTVAAKTLWGGMRTLGGLAVSAARSRMGSVDLGGGGIGAGAGAGGMGKFFSRSAPEGSVSRGGGGDVGEEREGGEGAGNGEGKATYVAVLDLEPLLHRSGRGAGQAEVILEFPVEKDRSIAKLSFSQDGCSIGVVPRDGQGVKVYQLRPAPSSLSPSTHSPSHASPTHPRPSQTASSPSASSSSSDSRGQAWHIYHLRRGRTHALVDALEWSTDGRWAALGTRKGTVHVFATNPYGGRTDGRSHWEGRVRDGETALQPMPTEMGPIVRLRAGAGAASSSAAGGNMLAIARTRPPLAFKFIEASERALPKHLLPTHLPSFSSPHPHSHSHSASYTHPRSYSSQHTDRSHNTNNSPPHSPLKRGRDGANYQDMLLFDPMDATLSLRRVMLEMRARDQGLGMGILDGGLARAAGVTSVSLPGMGFAGGFAGVSSSPSSGGGAFGQGRLIKGTEGSAQERGREREGQMELGARESTVMTWSLAGWQGGEVRKILGAEVEGGEEKEKGGRADWLAQAELSTCAKSPNILPRSIYLSHQFSFHTLGEDYHALIRRYQLDIGGLKIDVRREVQVSAYSAGGVGESFVEGFASPRDIRHHRTLSSSFDEPLASALANELDHPHISGVLPMLPNGTPSSFRNAIPIRRTIGDGMSESLGRLRREINKVRSPRLRPRPDSVMSASVPLEFDEEDEDFVGPAQGDGLLDGERESERDALDVPVSSSRETSRGNRDSGSGPTVSTPATSEDDWDVNQAMGPTMEKAEDTWGGWSAQDKLAVEEVEKFDNIDVLGLLDEEQTHVGARPQTQPPVMGGGGEKKRKGRGRRR
ncbi:hypothetical protein H0H87_000245 [Tephrocybe sp. NHM501043]|nr:hypothetical protein H0H87_000245 [Tephrocybe sp. NHM501043]